eukprot:CAMPEP_0185288108 /NCGR_PEP_ID=MMETSP1363-20130426/3202_1 /TAXON_ID=38817 /ORGANISM="Gephyrocapsa oceanica, Strain RCC1303" /LENGTH=284 /DNA_ID=CAMNT_0027883973 /DNA_START=91 /DNA_END=945 /DNA_ORIENTATION=-
MALRAGAPVMPAEPPTFDEMVASKKRLIDAHAADVEASLEWLGATLRAKEARTWGDAPGADLSVFNSLKLPGDVGFDPLNLAETEAHLLAYREAEIKHGRLAMLGVAGWVGSELLHEPAAYLLGAQSMLDLTDGRAPSVLNGGLGQFGGAFWLAAVGVAALLESATVKEQFEGWQSADKAWNYSPGDYGFDPLDLRGAIAKFWVERADVAPASEAERMELLANVKANIDTAEITHGRVAMLAITGFALQEAVWHTAVVDQSPIFFATPVYHGIASLFGAIRGAF